MSEQQMTIHLAEGITCPVCLVPTPVIARMIVKIYRDYICVRCGAYFDETGVTGEQLNPALHAHLRTQLGIGIPERAAAAQA